MGGYERDGESLSITSQFAVTLRACETAVMDQEAAYLDALSGPRSIDIDDDTLTIETQSGVLVFEAS